MSSAFDNISNFHQRLSRCRALRPTLSAYVKLLNSTSSWSSACCIYPHYSLFSEGPFTRVSRLLLRDSHARERCMRRGTQKCRRQKPRTSIPQLKLSEDFLLQEIPWSLFYFRRQQEMTKRVICAFSRDMRLASSRITITGDD